MTCTVTDLNESFCELQTDDMDFKEIVIDSLSIYLDGYRFLPCFRAGVCSGKKHFYKITDEGHIMFPKGLISFVIKNLKDNNKEFVYNRITYDLDEPTKEQFDEFVSTLGLPFKPYDYQLQAAYDAVRYKRLLIGSSTGCLDPSSEILADISEDDYKYLVENFGD